MVAARDLAEWASMSASRIWISAMRCGIGRGFGFRRQRRQFGVTGHDGLEQALGAARRLLRHGADSGVAGQAYATRFRLQFAKDEPEERGFSHAVAADEPTLWPSGIATEASSSSSRPPIR